MKLQQTFQSEEVKSYSMICTIIHIQTISWWDTMHRYKKYWIKMLMVLQQTFKIIWVFQRETVEYLGIILYPRGMKLGIKVWHRWVKGGIMEMVALKPSLFCPKLFFYVIVLIPITYPSSFNEFWNNIDSFVTKYLSLMKLPIINNSVFWPPN